MRFRFNQHKALEAAGVVFKADDVRRMNYMRLLKLLYLADRRCVQRAARPITGDRVYAMERGPVLSEILHLIKQQHDAFPEWDACFQRRHFDLEMIKEPRLASLSRFEIEILQETAEEHREHDEWALVDIVHQLDEYKKNDPRKLKDTKRLLIPMEDVFEAVGRAADIAAVYEDLAAESILDKVLGRR